MEIWKEALAVEDYVIACRRHIHENPELSDQEEQTVEFIMSELEKAGIECVNVPKGGVMGFIPGGKPGKTLLLRADIDALPVQEDDCNQKQPKVCVSKVPGVSHACGHDTHTAILLGAARILHAHAEELAGQIILYFERGEESGNGDYYMMQYLQTHQLQVDGCWGLHVKIGIPTGKVTLLPGEVYAGNAGFGITILGENALACGMALVNSLNTARMRNITPYERMTLTCTSVQYDRGECTIRGNCRYYDFEKVGKPICRVVRRIMAETVEAYGCTTKKPPYCSGGNRGVINHPVCHRLAVEAVTKTLGADAIVPAEPTMGAESFSVLSSYYPSFYAGYGARNPEKGMCAAGHSPQFEPDEAAFKYGVAATLAYAQEFLAYTQPIAYEGFRGTIDEYLAESRRV